MAKLIEEVTPHENPAPLSDWIYIPQFLPQQVSDSLYAAMESFPWLLSSECRAHVNYGKSYAAQGKLGAEYPIHPILLPIAERIAAVAHKQANYIQCHRMDGSAVVTPHKDPAGMIVPMLT